MTDSTACGARPRPRARSARPRGGCCWSPRRRRSCPRRRARAPSASTRTTSSSSLSVADSPVVPPTTSPSEPLASRWRPSATAASSLTAPSPWNGVTMAVRRPSYGRMAIVSQAGRPLRQPASGSPLDSFGGSVLGRLRSSGAPGRTPARAAGGARAGRSRSARVGRRRAAAGTPGVAGGGSSARARPDRASGRSRPARSAGRRGSRPERAGVGRHGRGLDRPAVLVVLDDGPAARRLAALATMLTLLLRPRRAWPGPARPSSWPCP